MSDIVFCRTRHTYDSYQDFWRLVELSQFPIIYVDELDPQDGRTYIITPANGEWQTGWNSPRSRIIHWQLEWHLEQYPHTPIAGVSEVWCSDAWQARNINAKYVPMGSHRDLYKVKSASELPPVDYDVAYLGYFVPRRAQIGTELDALGLSRSPTAAWAAERHTILSHSRAYLHVHQHGHVAGVPALRMVVAATYKLPVISERVEDCGIFGQPYMLVSDYPNLAQFVKLWTRDKDLNRLADYGLALNSLLCWQYSFRRSVEEAL